MNTEFFSKSLSPASHQLAPLARWAYGLLNAAIVGGAGAVVSAFGLATAHGMGDTQVPLVNRHIFGIIFFSGAASKFFIYLAQGLPGLNQGNPQGNNPTVEPPKNNP